MTGFLLPEAGLDAIVTDVQHYGRLGVETGMFLLSAPGTTEIAVVALLGEDGVRRESTLLVISANVIDSLFTFAEDRDLRVSGYLHSHKYEAFMSVTDKKGTIRTPGFVAGVIPDFADPPATPSLWGWWRYEPPEWLAAAPALVTTGQPVQVVRADAHSVMDVREGLS